MGNHLVPPIEGAVNVGGPLCFLPPTIGRFVMVVLITVEFCFAWCVGIEGARWHHTLLLEDGDTTPMYFIPKRWGVYEVWM